MSVNPSSLPIETWTDHTYSVADYTGTITYSETENFTVGFTRNHSATHEVRRFVEMNVSASYYGPQTFTLYLYDALGNITHTLIPMSSVYFTGGYDVNPLIWDITVDGTTYNQVSYWMAEVAGGQSLYVSYADFAPVTLTDTEYFMTGLTWAGVATMASHDWDYLYSASYVHVTEDEIIIVDSSTGISHTFSRSDYIVKIVATLGATSVPYRTASLTDTYGDPALGWTLPNVGTTQSRYDYWSNNQVNRGATFYVNLDAGEYVGMMATDTITRSSAVDIRVYRDASGMAYVDQDAGTEAHALGQYSAVQIKITKDSYVITGIKSWPAMYGPVSGLNSITIDRDATTFTMVKLLQYNNTTSYWRVDLADIQMGDYATTLDATLNLTEIFPAKSIALSMNSIAVYGDSLTVLGAQQPFIIPIDNGRISVSGQTFPLRGSLWMWTLNEDGQTYDLTINGYKIDDIRTDMLSMAAIRYGGEWSTIITGYTVTPVTGVVTEWVPGVFAFDAQTMAAAAMLSAVAAFVVLGMTGRRSLPKAGILALICGGGVLVFMLLV